MTRGSGGKTTPQVMLWKTSMVIRRSAELRALLFEGERKPGGTVMMDIQKRTSKTLIRDLGMDMDQIIPTRQIGEDQRAVELQPMRIGDGGDQSVLMIHHFHVIAIVLRNSGVTTRRAGALSTHGGVMR